MTTALTKLPADESVRRLTMAKAVIPTIKPDLFHMGAWLEVQEPADVKGPEDMLQYDKDDVHLCGTVACFAGHMALRKEFQDLGLGFDDGGVILVRPTTPLPDGGVVRKPEPGYGGLSTMQELGWFLGIEWDEAMSLFMPDSWLHTDDEGDPLPAEESLKAVDVYLDRLITSKETA